MEENLSKEIEHLKEKITKLENYIKVNDYEDYNNVHKYISFIDYFALDYIKKHEWLGKQLNFDYRMMVRARIKNDFLEFCRYAYLQIELMIDVFITEQERRGEITVERNEYNEIKVFKDKNNNTYEGSKRKLEFCLQLIGHDKQKMKEVIR